MRLFRRELLVVSAFLVLLAGCDASKPAALQQIADGVAHANHGEYSEAVRRFDAALTLDPVNPQAHYFIGLIRLQHFNDPAGAATALESSILLAPEDAEARYQLGIALERLSRPDDASGRFAEALALAPEHAGALYRTGLISEETGEIRDAIDFYTRSIYADPYFPLSYNALGNIYFRYGRPQEALQVFQNGIDNAQVEGVDAQMGNATNRADLGRVYMDLGEMDLAISYLRDAMTFDASMSSIPFNLGIAYSRRYSDGGAEDDREEAIAYFTRARMQCRPQMEQARCNSIAAALSDLRNDREEEE